MSKCEDLLIKTQEFSKQKNLFLQYFEDTFRICIKELFDQNPLVQGVYWDHYTPYFNDGNPCTMIRSDVTVWFDNQYDNSTLYDEEGEFQDPYESPESWGGVDNWGYQKGWSKGWYNGEYIFTLKQTCNDLIGTYVQMRKQESNVVNFIKNFEDWLLKDTFGDQVRIYFFKLNDTIRYEITEYQE